MYIRKFTTSKNGNQYFMVKFLRIDARFRPVDRHEIVKDKSIEELNAQLVSLVGENGAKMLIKCFQKQEK